MLLADQGHLESVIVGGQGRLFFTTADAVMSVRAPGAKAKVLAKVEVPGGLAFDSDGRLIVGSGNSPQNGSTGDETGPSKLFAINTRTGAKRLFAEGLSMGNGLVRGLDGTFYSSNDFGSSIDRIRGGRTQRNWANVQSGNGLVIDPRGRYLYAAQTFVPAAISRVDTLHPERVKTFAAGEPADAAAGLDGMARDPRGRIFVTANGAGEVWSVGTDGKICVILDDLPPFPDGPSAVAVGRGRKGFEAGNIYVVTFDGNLIEVPGVAASRPAPGFRAPRISLAVRPRRAAAGRRTAFRFRAVIPGATPRPISGAWIRLAGRSVRTGSDGRAEITRRLRAGTHFGRAWAPGLRHAAVKITVPGRR